MYNSTKICTYFLILILAISFSGCQQLRQAVYKHPLHKPEPVKVTTESPMSKLERAELLLQSANCLDALIKYREVMACSRDSSEIDRAKLGGAACLLRVKKYPAALAILEPLPLDVRGEADIRKLGLAGEILIYSGRPQDAEVYLEIAVGALDLESLLEQLRTAHQNKKQNADHDNEQFEIAEIDSWIPAMVANLGCAYLKNDKPEHALIMYQFASEIYKQRGEMILAERSLRMYDDIASIMRQYAPYKPIPVANIFSSGKK
ncbi:MAG: hypothetical protein LBQ66_11355 [Planctomycetaceae bacterium]|jgi:tetratricopeptide (TPR) repeat protein|nr:hypothetical protein [Planctomycetaceae bacterium]